MFLLEIWRRITTSRPTREREAAANRENAERESALREGIARRTHALEAQIAQAHAENCRLRAENRALLNSVLGIAGIPPVIVADPPVAAGEVASAGRPGLPLIGASAAADCAGADACLDAAHSTMSRGAGTPACVVSPLSPNDTSETAKKNTDKSVCATNRTRRAQAAKDPHAIAPIRRRSWHQIYRMLEFESSRRKDQDL
jgi:hypothetical protein